MWLLERRKLNKRKNKGRTKTKFSQIFKKVIKKKKRNQTKLLNKVERSPNMSIIKMHVMD